MLKFLTISFLLGAKFSGTNLGPSVNYQNVFSFYGNQSIDTCTFTGLNYDGDVVTTLVEPTLFFEGQLSFNEPTENYDIKVTTLRLECLYTDIVCGNGDTSIDSEYDHSVFDLLDGHVMTINDQPTLDDYGMDLGFDYDSSNDWYEFHCFFWRYNQQTEETDDITRNYGGDVLQQYSITETYPTQCSVGYEIRFDYLYDFIGSANSFINNITESQAAYQTGFDNGFAVGHSRGVADGYAEGVGQNETIFTIFNGILNIAMVPINFFLAIFNFEILGINMTAVAMATLSIMILIICWRFITSGSAGHSSTGSSGTKGGSSGSSKGGGK